MKSCSEIQELYDLPDEHCATCHGDNMYHESVMLDYKFDGLIVEVCCKIRAALAHKGVEIMEA